MLTGPGEIVQCPDVGDAVLLGECELGRLTVLRSLVS